MPATPMPCPPPSRAGTTLVLIAAEIECRAFLSAFPQLRSAPLTRWQLLQCGPHLDLCMTGIGKANAAAAAAITLQPANHRAVLSLGIAGTLPGGPPIGTIVIASGCVWADEGVRTPTGFLGCDAIGFPIGPYPQGVVPVDATLGDALTQRLVAHRGLIATVSTCSGTDSLAHETATRTGAVAEAMEGAAVGHIAHARGIPFVEIRIISNTTGDRQAQRWEIKPALEILGRAARIIADASSAKSTPPVGS